MNRFYKPTPREYVSTHVDMPWEFMQGVAEQKQKGFDTAATGVDAAAKLLDFQVNPGDVPGKQKLQKEYNDRLLQVRDQLYQNGDYSGASRNLTGVVRDIVQDKRLANMKNAVEPHTKIMGDLEKLRSEGAPTLGLKADPMFATYDPETNQTRSYNQFAGYNAQKVNETMRKQLEEAVDNVAVNEKGWTRIGNGMYQDTEGKSVTRDRIEPLIEAIMPSIHSSYDIYLNDLNTQDKTKGQKEGSTFSNIVNSVIGERVFDWTKTKTRETESATGIKLKQWENRSDLGVTTGATTGESFSYKGVKQRIDLAKDVVSQLEASLNDPKNEKAKTANGRQLIQQTLDQAKRELIKAQEGASRIDDVLETSSNVTDLYEEYKTGMLASPTNKKLPLKSKEEFFNILTGKTPVIRGKSEFQGSENTLLNKLKSDYVEVAHEKATSGAYTTTNQYIIDYNPSGQINRLQDRNKQAIFNGEMYGTVRGGGDISGTNANTLIATEFPEADMAKSSIATIRNPKTNQPEYEFILRDEKGTLLKNGRFTVTPSDADRDNNASLYTNVFIENARNDYQAGNVKGYKKNVENIALTNYGEDLSQLTRRANEGLPISKNTPLPVGDFYVFTDPNNPNIYFMTQGEIVDGKVMLSSNYEKSATIRNPDGTPSNALNYSDITGKLGQGILMQAGN